MYPGQVLLKHRLNGSAAIKRNDPNSFALLLISFSILTLDRQTLDMINTRHKI